MPEAEIARWLLFGALGWLLPGVGYASLLRHRLSIGPRATDAVIWWAVPGLVSALGVLLGGLGLAPVHLIFLVVGPGVVLALRRSAWRAAAVQPRESAFWLLLLPASIFIWSWMMPVHASLTSDTFAHVAAVRSTMEEARIFPVEGFHGDDISRGADARFGVLHAAYGAVASITGSGPLDAWHRLRGAALLLIIVGALALLEGLRASRLATWVGMFAVLFAYGGTYYNLIEVAAYPLWCSLGLTWTVLAVLFSADLRHVRLVGLVVGLGMAAAVGIHFFAFLLAAVLVACVALSAPSNRRSGFVRVGAIAALVTMPVLAVRILISYANANPIHNKVWECFEWSEGLYSVSPIFVSEWLTLVGFVGLAWAAWAYRQLRGDWRYRWCLVCSSVALVWLGVPFFLTPSMELLGFLPLRMIMAIPVPFLVATLLDGTLEAGGTRKRLLAAGLIVLMLPLSLGRARALVADDSSSTAVESPAWQEMLATLDQSSAEPARLLGDPFSMMAVRAMGSAFVVAVPDGRSSPRDPIAIDRLRDSWSAMSASTNGDDTSLILDRYAVTHVLVSELLPDGMASYEYPIHRESVDGQKLKFESNPSRFRLLYSGGGLALFEVMREHVDAWDESYLAPCLVPRQGGDTPLSLGGGYKLRSASVRLESTPGVPSRLLLGGELYWDGSGHAPDRILVVRLDRVDGPVPEALHFVEKPVRKTLEALGKGVWRYRWTTYPAGGRCPIWLTGSGGTISLDVALSIPVSASRGQYLLHLAATDLSIFTPLRLKDFLSDEDSYQGPVVGTVEID